MVSNVNCVESREIVDKFIGSITHFIVLPISDKIYLCSYAQLRLTATTGFRITMVSLSQLQLSRVVEIVDNLVGLIWHFILLQIIPKVSNHLSSTYLH
jgi:hypothetical protein